jgi:hypothetical protein
VTTAAAPANATPPAAAAADDAAQAAADEKPLTPLDHDAEIKDQIERAKEVVARDERKKAREEKKAARAKPKSTPKSTPAPAAEPQPEATAEPAQEAEPEAEEPARGMGSTLIEARKLFAAGDLDGALEKAFGKKSDAFRVNSAKWAEWRKANQAASRQLAEREQKLANGVKAVEQKFGHFVEAAQLFEKGDVVGALKVAWKVDPETFQKRLLAQFHGKHPDVERLERQLRERDEADERRRREAEEAGRHEQQRQQTMRNLQLIGEHLAQHEDEAVVELSKRPRFRARVLQILSEHYDPASKTSIPLEQAAEMVKQEIEDEFGTVFRPRSVSESPRRAGTTHARPATATLSNRGAAEASPPGGQLSDEELFRKYSRLGKTATG